MIAALATSVVMAASPASQFLTVTTVTCDSTSHSVGGDATLAFDVTTDVLVTLRVSGTQILANPGVNPPGTLSGTWALGYSYPSQPDGYEVEWKWYYTVNGKPVWENVVSFTCVSGVPTGVSVTNKDLTLTAGCSLNVPAGAVVGEAPLGAQAYYEPGNIASGVVLNPGTYIVIGQDASETYYKIVLACQYLWVRKDTMQPSYLPPQNGLPLPTRTVS